MDIIQRELDNGIPVIFVPQPNTRTFFHLCMTGGGSRYETERTSGISHLLEHMMFKGTKKRPTAKEIAEELDLLGGPYNAFTGREYIGFYASATDNYFSQVADLLSDQVLNSKLSGSELELEKGAVIEEINEAMTTPSDLVTEILPGLVYGDQAAGRSVLGTIDTVRSITREQLRLAMNRFFVANNFVVAIAGNLPNEDRALQILNEYYGKMTRGKNPRKYKVKPVTQNEPEVLIKNLDIPQAWIALAVRSPSISEDDYNVLRVMDTLLGTGMSSRLFSEIRERRGIAYSIYSFPYSDADTGNLVVCGGMNSGRTHEALSVIKEELYKLAEEPVSGHELETVKERIRNMYAFRLDNSERIAQVAAMQFTRLGHVKDPENEVRLMESVTAEDIQRLAQSMFKNSNLNLSVVGPHTAEDREEFQEAISF
ncbi:MAG: pitrilysin family protein [Candidatus Spechtbacterales bacterium]